MGPEYWFLAGGVWTAAWIVAGFVAAWKAQGFRVELVRRDLAAKRSELAELESVRKLEQAKHDRYRAASEARIAAVRRGRDLGHADLDSAVGMLFGPDDAGGGGDSPNTPAGGPGRPERTGAGDPEPLDA